MVVVVVEHGWAVCLGKCGGVERTKVVCTVFVEELVESEAM